MVGSLFKYLPSQYAPAFLNGRLLFRNLSYFRRCEDPARADHLEARHVDRPGKGVFIKNLSNGSRFDGDFAFVNATRAQDIYALCVSTEHSEALYCEFGVDACIEIVDVEQFTQDLGATVRRRRPPRGWELISNSVEYYEETVVATRNVKNPRNLPFFKPKQFAHQKEFRFVLAHRSAFQLEERLVLGPTLGQAERAHSEREQSLVLRIRKNRPYFRLHLRSEFSARSRVPC